MDRMVRTGLLSLLACCAIVIVYTWVVPGPLSIDEVLYHRMTRDLVAGNGFFLENGYEQMPSPELEALYLRATADGHLAAQYPYGTAVLAAPFYVALGLRGMFVVSALAFVAALWLCRRIALQLLRDRTTALVACLLLATTYLAEYGVAAWPHATAVVAVLGAATLAIDGYRANGRRALVLAAASGLVAGVGATFRLDVLFCLPALGAPFFFASPTRFRSLLALGAGLIPGAAFIVATNLARWHALSPLSYGPQQQTNQYPLFALAAASPVIPLWLATRPRSRAWLRAHAQQVTLAGLFVVLGGVLVVGADSLLRSVQGIGTLTFDMRLLPTPGEVIGSKALIFGAGFKKSLLQSSPFLAVALVALWRAVKQREDLRRIGWLFVVPATLIGFFGAFAWHGGICLNQRYLLGALPFLCILVAYVVRPWLDGGRTHWLAALVAVAVAIAYRALIPMTFEGRETFFLTVPALLSLAVLAASVVAERGRATVLAVLAVAGAAGWSAANTYDDARNSRSLRAYNYNASRNLAAVLPDHAIVFVTVPEPYYGIIEYRDDVIVALPYLDQSASAGSLIARSLATGRRVFVAMPKSGWNELESRGALAGKSVRRLSDRDHVIVGEVEAR